MAYFSLPRLQQTIANIKVLLDKKQNNITSTGATNLLTAPTAAGGQPGTKAISDFYASGSKVADSELLDGHDSSYFLNTDTPITGYVQTSEKGAANGLATLTSELKVTPSQIASPATTILTSITLSPAHAGRVLRCNNASAITITIPYSDTLEIFTEIEILRYNIGAVTIEWESQVTFHSVGGLHSIKNQYGSVSLKKLTTSGWVLSGDLG